MSFAVCCFIALNVPLGLIGLLLFATGTLLGLFDSVVRPMLDPYMKQLPIPSDSSTNLGSYLTAPSIAFTVIGAVFCVLSVLTCMTFCGRKKATSLCYIIIYDSVLAVLLILTLCMIIITAKAESLIGGMLSSYLSSTLTNDYVAVDTAEPTNILWNVAQMSLQCCGVWGGSDYVSAKKFNRTWITMQDPTTYTVSMLEMVIPPSCCTTEYLDTASTAYSSTTSSSSSSAYMANAQLMANCVYHQTSGSSNYEISCLSVFWLKFKSFMWYIVGPAIAVFIVLLFLFVVPIVVIWKNRKAENQQKGKDAGSRPTTPAEGSVGDGDQDPALRGGHLY